MPRNSYEDDIERMNPNAEDAEQAAFMITKAFVWDATTEGHGYWQEVADKLRDIAIVYTEKED